MQQRETEVLQAPVRACRTGIGLSFRQASETHFFDALLKKERKSEWDSSASASQSGRQAIRTAQTLRTTTVNFLRRILIRREQPRASSSQENRSGPHTKNFLRNHSQHTMRSSVSPADAFRIITSTSQTANARKHFTKRSCSSATAKPQHAARRTERLQENF